MGDYINRTSLGFILVFISIIAVSLALFQVLAYFDTTDESVPVDKIRAETKSETVAE